MKTFLVQRWFSLQGIERLADAKSEKQAKLYYIIEPFENGSLMKFHTCKLLAANEGHVFFFLKPL
jgi:hypothetical protein